MTRLLKILMIVAAVVAAFIAALMMHGCATTGAIAAACKPSTTDETNTVLSILGNVTLSNAEAVAALEASKVAFCVITELAKRTRDALTGAVALQTADPMMTAVSLAHSNAWLMKHP
jgi:hypothetical protein